MFREVGNTERTPFSARLPARNKQSPRISSGNHNRIPFRQHFRTQQQERWQRNTTNQTANKSNVNTPETSGNYLLQHFSRTSSTRKIKTRPSFREGNVPGGIKTKCSSRRKHFPFRPILEKFIKDQEILEIVKGYRIPLLRTPVQEKSSSEWTSKRNQIFLVEKEIKKMFEKGAIKKVSQHKDQHAQNQFLSNLFLVRKKDGGYRPVINLKTLNQFVPYIHFKIEILQALKYMMKGRDYMSIWRRLILQYFWTNHVVEISTNSCAYVLVSDQPLEFLPKFWKSQYPLCTV